MRDRKISTIFVLIKLAILVCTIKPSACFSQSSVRLTDPEVAHELSHIATKEISTKNDPIYHDTRHYEGYEIEGFLNWLSTRASLPLTEAVVTFIATDGYRSRHQVKDLPKRLGILAYKEQNSASRSFSDSKHGKVPFNPGPYALVWEGSYSDTDHLPTPWSIVEVLLERDSLPQELIPNNKSANVLRGLTVWREQCSRCHSLNKVGGAVGPELNVPVNITEFWPRERILQMIENPASLRWGSAMPSFAWLPSSDREAVLKYLEAMREAKVCRSAVECSESAGN